MSHEKLWRDCYSLLSAIYRNDCEMNDYLRKEVRHFFEKQKNEKKSLPIVPKENLDEFINHLKNSKPEPKKGE